MERNVFIVRLESIASVAFVLMTISLLASFVPARRATMVDPLVALRAD